MNEYDDPEDSYRRGYEQGAYAATIAAERLALLPGGLERLRRWAGIDVHRWRYLDQPTNRSISPPLPPN
jgi:hypothetical protein